jgi:hypothetical protein
MYAEFWWGNGAIPHLPLYAFMEWTRTPFALCFLFRFKVRLLCLNLRVKFRLLSIFFVAGLRLS